MQEMTTEQLKKLEETLQADIRWCIDKGMKWNAMVGAYFVNGVWVESEPNCGVCAVGAHVLRTQCTYVDDDVNHPWESDDVQSAAKNLGVDPEWLDTLYGAVTHYPEDDDEYQDEEYQDAVEMGHRLRDFAEAYTKEHAAKTAAQA